MRSAMQETGNKRLNMNQVIDLNAFLRLVVYGIFIAILKLIYFQCLQGSSLIAFNE